MNFQKYHSFSSTNVCKPSTLKLNSNLPQMQRKQPFFTFVNQFEKVIVLTFGTYPNVKEPGIRLFIPAIQNIHRVDMRTRIHELPPQQIITRDNVSASVNAVIYFHIFDAYKSVFKVDNVNMGVDQMGQTELRNILCQKSFNEILESRGQLSETIAKNMAAKCEEWGVIIEHLQVCCVYDCILHLFLLFYS